MSETDIQAKILSALKSHPSVHYLFRQNVAKIRRHGAMYSFGEVGQSDLLGELSDGRFLAVEIKIPGKKRTINQIAFQEHILAGGGEAFVATSKEEALQKINEIVVA